MCVLLLVALLGDGWVSFADRLRNVASLMLGAPSARHREMGLESRSGRSATRILTPAFDGGVLCWRFWVARSDAFCQWESLPLKLLSPAAQFRPGRNPDKTPGVCFQRGPISLLPHYSVVLPCA